MALVSSVLLAGMLINKYRRLKDSTYLFRIGLQGGEGTTTPHHSSPAEPGGWSEKTGGSSAFAIK
jgi:hypothetical protein